MPVVALGSRLVSPGCASLFLSSCLLDIPWSERASARTVAAAACSSVTKYLEKPVPLWQRVSAIPEYVPARPSPYLPMCARARAYAA